MWEIGRLLGHYGDHPRPQVADRGTPSRVDKRVAPVREGATDKQCQGEGKLWSQYVITNREEGKGKPPRLLPKIGYPLGYPEPALQQKTEERENLFVHCRCRRTIVSVLRSAPNSIAWKPFIRLLHHHRRRLRHPQLRPTSQADVCTRCTHNMDDDNSWFPKCAIYSVVGRYRWLGIKVQANQQ